MAAIVQMGHLGVCSWMKLTQALGYVDIFAFDVVNLLEQDVQASFGEPPFLVDDAVVFVNLNSSLLLLHRDEVLLGVRPDLGASAGADELLHLPPVLAVKSNCL